MWLALVASAANAASTGGSALTKRYDVSIQKTTLVRALREVTERAAVDFAGVSDLIPGQLQVGPIIGRYSLSEALAILLKDSGLTYELINNHTVVLVKPQMAQTSSPPRTDRDANMTRRDKGKLGKLGALIATCGPLLYAGTANCQNAPTDAAAPANQLQEVVVTAERRTADLQRTPVAVSVRTGAELQQQGKFTVNQILEDVPSVAFAGPPVPASNVGDSPANLIAIRGVQSNGLLPGSSSSAVPAVAEYVDGVVNGLGGNYDLTQVEVLRGPQGTLYGRSATAGVVNIHTADPIIGRFGGNAAAEIGNYDLQHYSAAVNLPAGDVFAVRAAGNFYRRNGYDAPQGGKVDSTDGRLKALFEPSNDFKVLLGVALQDNQEYSGQTAGILNGVGTDNVRFIPVIHNGQVQIGEGYDQTRQYWGQMDWNLGAATLTYISALRTFDQHTAAFNANPVVFATTNLQVPHDYFHTEELRLTSNSTTPLQWQTGLFLYRNDLTINSLGYLYFGPAPAPPVLSSEESPLRRRTEQAGLYGEGTYSFPTNTRVTAGVRGDYSEIQTDETECSAIPVPSCATVSGAQGDRVWHNFTFKARAEQDLTSRNLVYASLSSAFLPGDVAVTNGNNGEAVAPYEPETLTSLEVGSKNRFLESRLQLNADVFYYRYGQHQEGVQVGAIPNGGPPLFGTEGSPARMDGAELEGIWQFTPADRFALNASYIDAWYGAKPAVFAQAVTNSHLADIPPWTIDPTYSHTFTLPGDQTLTLLGEALYHSGYLVTDLADIGAAADFIPFRQNFSNGSVLTGNFTATWNPASKLSVSAYVRNVSDQRYKTTVIADSTSPQTSGATLSDPRTYGIVVSARF